MFRRFASSLKSTFGRSGSETDKTAMEGEVSRGREALVWAAVDGRDDIARRILSGEGGKDIQIQNGDCEAALLVAAAYEHTAVVKLLLDHGADKNHKDEEGRSPLLWAAAERCKEVVRLLLDNGVDIEAQDNEGMNPLLVSARFGHDQVADLLLDRGAAFDPAVNGRRMLGWAAFGGYSGMMKLLIRKGVDINTKDENSRTAILYAAEQGNEAIVDLLLRAGADPKIEDSAGSTALSLASEAGHDAVVKLLI